MSNLIQIYNPANASALTDEQVKGLQNLSSDEIKQLAAAYPNGAHARAYLLIIDKSKPAEKQLPSLSTFQNLWNLREKNGLKNLVAWRFRDNYKPASAKIGKPIKAKKTEVLDLSETDLLNLPGFKAADKQFEGQRVEVIKLTDKPTETKAKRGRKPKTENKSTK